jgi:hypothetical protein
VADTSISSSKTALLPADGRVTLVVLERDGDSGDDRESGDSNTKAGGQADNQELQDRPITDRHQHPG